MNALAIMNNSGGLQVDGNDPANHRRAALETIGREEAQATAQAVQARSLAQHYTALAVEFEAIADSYATSRSRLAGR